MCGGGAGAIVKFRPELMEFTDNLFGESRVKLEKLIHILQFHRELIAPLPDEAIPDSAPHDIKDLLGRMKGKTFIMAVEVSNDEHMVIRWYEPHNFKAVFVFDIIYPMVLED